MFLTIHSVTASTVTHTFYGTLFEVLREKMFCEEQATNESRDGLTDVGAWWLSTFRITAYGSSYQWDGDDQP